MKSANTEKLQKVIARIGVASRREAERWIEAGRVRVNGKIAGLGARVDGHASISIDGKLINNTQQTTVTRVIMYNKPEGEICTRHDPQSRPIIFSALPNLKTGRWITVGRLDLNTSGLLLLTNNGELANYLMHPSSEIEREYAVRIYGEITEDTIKRLKQGVELKDGLAKFTDIQYQNGKAKNHWYKVTLSEGRNREVRRLWESQGVRVSRLIRVRFGKIHLPRNLQQGQWHELTADKIKQLHQIAT